MDAVPSDIRTHYNGGQNSGLSVYSTWYLVYLARVQRAWRLRSSSAAGCRSFSDSPPYAAGLPYRSVQRAAAMADSHKSLLQQEQEQDDHADQLHTGVLRIKEQAGLIKRELDDQNIILERLEEDVDKAEGSMSSLNRKMHHHWVEESPPHAHVRQPPAHTSIPRPPYWAAGGCQNKRVMRAAGSVHDGHVCRAHLLFAHVAPLPSLSLLVQADDDGGREELRKGHVPHRADTYTPRPP